MKNWNKLILILVLLLSGCSVFKGQPDKLELPPEIIQKIAEPVKTPLPGVDTLGAAKFPKELKAVPLDHAIGGFAKTFGDFLPVAKKELEKGRKFIRVQLQWCDNHNCFNVKAAAKEAKRYQPLCLQYPNRVELSPFCEHNIKKDIDKLLDTVQANAPNCRIINTPWQGMFSSKYKNEIHGNHKIPEGPYNYSYDGTNSVDSDVVKDLKTHSRADVFFVWHPRMNGKWSMKDTTPRPQRKGWPSIDMLESLVYLFTDKGFVSIPKNWLIKSHADNHTYLGKPDLRGDKLLVISPIKAAEIILKRGQKVIAKLPYYSIFDGGGFRYYAKVMGYKLGKALEVFIGKKKYGTINGGFRDPTYR